jgi:hypothetical protein
VSYGKSEYFVLKHIIPFVLETGANITLRGVGDENGALLVDANPSSSCFGCPVTQTDFSSFQYAQVVTTDMGVNLVSSGIPVGQGDPRPFGVSPETTQMVCCLLYQKMWGFVSFLKDLSLHTHTRLPACTGAGVTPDVNSSGRRTAHLGGKQRTISRLRELVIGGHAHVRMAGHAP